MNEYTRLADIEAMVVAFVAIVSVGNSNGRCSHRRDACWRGCRSLARATSSWCGRLALLGGCCVSAVRRHELTFLIQRLGGELPKSPQRAVVEVLKVDLELARAHVQRRLVCLDDCGNLLQLFRRQLVQVSDDV